jgi:hypothetical protein
LVPYLIFKISFDQNVLQKKSRQHQTKDSSKQRKNIKNLERLSYALARDNPIKESLYKEPFFDN